MVNLKQSVSTTNRFFQIDFLRAIAILGVMLTHSLAIFLGSTVINTAWNYLHFVVVAFVFCSGYVTVSTYKHINNGKSLLIWYKKRFARLYLPFIIYTIIYIILHLTHSSSRYLFDSLTLVGGIDVGWLTLLFLQLALLTPIIIRISNKHKFSRILLIAFAIFTLITTFIRIPTLYSRSFAWFPWLFIFLLGIYISQNEKNNYIHTRYYFFIGIISICLWFLFSHLLNNLHQPLTLTLHKYPPDMFYFLYGIGINCLLFCILNKWKKLFQYLRTPITWLSKNSYGMFFIHLILLDIATKTISRGNLFI